MVKPVCPECLHVVNSMEEHCEHCGFLLGIDSKEKQQERYLKSPALGALLCMDTRMGLWVQALFLVYSLFDSRYQLFCPSYFGFLGKTTFLAKGQMDIVGSI